MEIQNWQIDPKHIAPIVGMFAVSVGFAIFWFITKSKLFKKLFFATNNEDASWVRFVFFSRLTGALLVGVIPGILLLYTTDIEMNEFGLFVDLSSKSLLFILVVGSIFVFANSKLNSNPKLDGYYPEMRVKFWNLSRFAVNALGWVLFFTAVEFMYRGILLQSCISAFGLYPALAINVCLYSATHMVKGPLETFGAVVFGIALCLISLETGSLFAAIVVHVILGVSNDYFAIKSNPEMEYEVIPNLLKKLRS